MPDRCGATLADAVADGAGDAMTSRVSVSVRGPGHTVMTSPDRAASTLHGDGGSTPVAAAQHPRDAPPGVVPGVPSATVGPADPDAGGPTVHQADDDPGWAASVTKRCGHYVTEGAIRVMHASDRPVGYAACGVPAFVDEQGLEEGGQLPRCPECLRKIAGKAQ